MRALLIALTIVLGLAAPSSARETVSFSGYRPGTIVVFTNARTLYYVLDSGRAIRYPVGVGKAGMAWTGHARVARKLRRPSWGPPDDLWSRNRNLPYYVPGGAPNNPMGEAVLGLDRGNYAIHGTNSPSSIGQFVSHGCIRMYNADILDLYARVPVGTEVIVQR